MKSDVRVKFMLDFKIRRQKGCSKAFECSFSSDFSVSTKALMLKLISSVIIDLFLFLSSHAKLSGGDTSAQGMGLGLGSFAESNDALQQGRHSRSAGGG